MPVEGSTVRRFERSKCDRSPLTVEALHALKQAQEYILHEILGFSPVMQDSKTNSKHKRGVAIEQKLDGMTVALFHPEDQIFVAKLCKRNRFCRRTANAPPQE